MKSTLGVRILCAVLVVFSVVAVMTAGGCEKRAKQIVQVTYREQAKVGLPEGLQSIAFVPFTQAIEDKENIYTAREKKWGDHVISVIAAKMQEQARENEIPLDVVDRESVVSIMKEKDLADSGLAEPNEMLQLGKLANAQAICYGKLLVNIRTAHGKARVVSGLGHGPYGLVPRTEQRSTIKRTITVAADIKLVAVATGQSIHTFSSHHSSTIERKPGVLMGKDATEADLQPEDETIGSLIEQISNEFVADLMPHDVVISVKLANVKTQPAKTAGKLMMVGDYDEAIDLYKQSRQLEDGQDDHGAIYNLGVAYELTHQLDKALECYKQAYTLGEKEEYHAAYMRLKKKNDE